jgi:glycosyltransferase involved in cell wall biosynthesis
VPELQALASSLGIASRVSFAGLVPPEQVGGYVKDFDIALQPSATPYASPLKIFDYMAAGCAIVAPDQPNIREVLAHRETALLFSPTEAGALWHAVETLIADSPLRGRLGESAREELQRRDYTWAANASRIINLSMAV